ncbi:MAG: hypothetical protein U0324_42900 [Polyangiales bacterium]
MGAEPADARAASSRRRPASDQRSADGGFGYFYGDVLPGRSVNIRPGSLWTTIDVVFSNGGRAVPIRCGSDPALACE